MAAPKEEPNEEKKEQLGEPVAVARTILRESVVVLLIRLLVLQTLFASLLYCTDMLLILLSDVINNTSLVSWFTLLRLFLWVAIIGYTSLIVLRWRSTHYEIRKGVIIKRRGIIFKREDEFICNIIESITLYQGFMGRMFDYGTLEIYDPALQKRIYMHNISRPNGLRELIRKVVVNDHPPASRVVFEKRP